jgi:hypothetical protein
MALVVAAMDKTMEKMAYSIFAVMRPFCASWSAFLLFDAVWLKADLSPALPRPHQYSR